MSYKILPYKANSASVMKLKDELGAVVLRVKNSRYRYREGHTIINWGASKLPDSLRDVEPENILNSPGAVAGASNKLIAFRVLEGDSVSTVPFTADPVHAQAWLDGGHKVFVRNKLTGHSGDGIEVIQNNINPYYRNLEDMVAELHSMGRNVLAGRVEEEMEDLSHDIASLPDAPLYTRAVSNKGEYRVHVMDGEVILYQKKSRRVGEDGEVVTAEGEEADVRNLASNWIYRTGNLKRLERIENLALDTIEALGLDFGAVDIINDNDNNVYVLEVNTAPGLGNEDSLEAYVEGFNQMVA